MSGILESYKKEQSEYQAIIAAWFGLKPIKNENHEDLISFVDQNNKCGMYIHNKYLVFSNSTNLKFMIYNQLGKQLIEKFGKENATKIRSKIFREMDRRYAGEDNRKSYFGKIYTALSKMDEQQISGKDSDRVLRSILLKNDFNYEDYPDYRDVIEVLFNNYPTTEDEKVDFNDTVANLYNMGVVSEKVVKNTAKMFNEAFDKKDSKEDAEIL